MRNFIIYPVLFLLCNCMTISANDFSLKQRNQDQNISHLRPRLFVRADNAKLGRGLTLSELRSKLNDPAYKEWVRISSERGTSSNTTLAMQYLLTGEKN